MSDIRFSSPAIQFVMNESSEQSPLKNIDKKCADFLDFLEALPKSIRHEKMSTKDWYSLWMKDYDKAQTQLNQEVNDDIEFIWTITSFKVYKLFKEIVRLIEEENFYASTGLLRMLTEITCFFAYTLEKIQPIVEQMNKHTNDFYEWDRLNLELEEITLKYTRGSKIKSLVEIGTDMVETISILTAIDYISKKEQYKDTRPRYDILCEYVHPNFFSNNFFSVITKLYSNDLKAELKNEKILVISGETDMYYRDIPSEFTLMSLNYLGILLHSLSTSMDLFKASLDGYRKVKVELMTAPKAEKLPPDLQKFIDELK